MFGIIYKATNVLTGLSYIGQTTKTLAHRKRGHEKSAKKIRKAVFQKAIQNYGFGSFKWKVLGIYNDAKELNRAEKEAIRKHKTLHPMGYNTVFGYGGRYIPSEETKRKNSEAHKGIKLPEEQKRKISNSLMGHGVTEEFRQRMKEIHTGKVATEETRKKLRDSHIGKKLSLDSIEKRSGTRRKNGWFKNPEQSKKKISERLEGHFVSVKTKKKISETKKGIPWSEARRMAYEARWGNESLSI